MTYEQALEKIHTYQRFGSRLGLERIRELLKRLGNPDQKLRIVHVAGTNGKGSVCRFLYEILNEAGYRTGGFFSPYIEKFTERIQCAGRQISEEDLARCAETVLARAEEMIAEGLDSPTEFEVVTATGLLYFAEQAIDVAVLEVGLGGVGDSTNVFERPEVTAITSIDFDHMEVLGDTLPAIAEQKAGILKQGVPVIASVKDEEARNVVKQKAGQLDAPFYDVTEAEITDVVQDISGYSFSVSFRMDDDMVQYDHLKLTMPGMHQVENAVCALHIIHSLIRSGYRIPEEAVRNGLKEAVQPARFEVLYDDPCYIILDGAHNYGGSRALAYTLHELFDGKNILLCVGILRDKEYDKMAKMLTKLHCDVICTSVPVERGMPAYDLADAFGRAGAFVIGIYDDYREAFDASVRSLQAYDAVVWAGSLYLMGPVRRLFEGEDS